jgi:DNA-directed RNA polymerase beta subunit
MDDISVIKNEDFEGKHDFLAEELLMPNANKTDGNRSTMFSSHLAQFVTLKDAEAPLVYTNFENQVGKYSTAGYKKAKRDYVVIGKIEKNKYNYVLVVMDLETKEYGILTREECKFLTEHYGFKWNNDQIDSYDEGSKIESEDVLFKNDNYDENMNFGYGVNMNTAYFSYKNLTLEDAVVISKSAAKRLGSYVVHNVRISVNTNDILLNLYGDDSVYKSFPDIGEDIKDQILASRRRINYDTALYELKNLKETRDNDDSFYASGKIVDVEVYSNIPEDELSKQDYNVQVKKYIDEQNNFCKEVYSKLKNIVEDPNNKISDELIHFYNNCKMQIDENVSYTYENSKFSGVILNFTILEEEPLKIGSKITGRYGNKGVISTILPDEEMPTVEEGPFKGLRADICLNPLGVFNRLNPSQLIEHELNWIAKFIAKDIENEKDFDKKKDILLGFIGEVNDEEAEIMGEFLDSLNKKDKKEFFEEIVSNGIPLCQKPFFGNVGLDDLERIYKKYDHVDYFKCENIATPLIIGHSYMIRLKHEPYSKFSARSTDLMNLKGLPAKSKSFKEHKQLYSKTPVRVGNMEIPNLSLANDMDSIMDLLNSYSNNEENRRELAIALLTGNPFDVNVELSEVESSTSKILNSLLTSIGYQIEDVEEDE